MNVAQKTRKIGDVCDLATGGTPSRSRPEYFGGDIRWLVSGDIHQREIFDCEGRITKLGMKNSNAKILPVNSVMIALNGQGKTRGTVALLRMPATCNQSLVSIFPKNPTELLPEYLYANLHGRYEEFRRMTSDDDKDRRGLNMALIRNVEIPIPPPAEQRRIVDILDKALESVTIAKANAETNLKNAHTLFKSHLEAIFNQHNAGWRTCSFVNCVETVQYTTKIQRKDFCENGEYPIVSQEAEFINGYWNNPADIFKVTTPIVIFGDHTKIVKYVDFDFVLGADGVKILQPKLFFIPKFFFYFLRSVKLKSLGYSRHYRLLKELEVSYPDTDDQFMIVKKLDALDEQIQCFRSVYRQKLGALDELKKSLLHQAFIGVL